MNLVKIKLKRFFKRIWWKIIPHNEQRTMTFLTAFKKTNRYPTIQSIDQTIDKLLTGNYSLARYGDGEFLLCLDRPIGFQKTNRKLRKRLTEILQDTSNKNCLVAITEFRTDRLTPFWKQFWHENAEDISSLLHPNITYYNQSVTREVKLHHIERLKALWENRDVIFVMGKGSRFDVNHELFKAVKKYEVIYGLPTNAWDNYSSVLDKVKKELPKYNNPLVICALGPAATVMAYDLSKLNVQALDLGHLTNVYDRLMYNKQAPESLSLVK
jgi:glycosyltransferase family protein